MGSFLPSRSLIFHPGRFILFGMNPKIKNTTLQNFRGWIALAAFMVPALMMPAFMVPALGGGSALAKPVEEMSENSVIVTIGKRRITLGELQSRDVHEKRTKLYQALIEQVKVRSVEILARSRKDYSTDINLAPSEAQIRNFYLTNGLSANGTFEDVAPRIRGYLVRQNRKRKIDEQFQRARQTGLVKVHIDEPAAYTVALPLGKPFLRGNPKARVMFAEFTDFQCPFCNRLQPAVNALIGKFRRRVAFATLHFPLNIHPEAFGSAIAVECARDQGGFEAYHQVLFINQRRQSPSDLKRYARQVKLANPARFDQCLDSRSHRKRVDNDLRAGLQVEVSGTPAMVIGIVDASGKVLRGELVVGARGLPVLEAVLLKYLNKAKR